MAKIGGNVLYPTPQLTFRFTKKRSYDEEETACFCILTIEGRHIISIDFFSFIVISFLFLGTLLSFLPALFVFCLFNEYDKRKPSVFLNTAS